MSETKDAVDRLRWLCEEAARRAAEETSDDFTTGLRPLEAQFDRRMELLLTRRVLSWGGMNLQWPKNLQTIDRYRPFSVTVFDGPFVDGDGEVYDTGFAGESRIYLMEPVGMGTGRSHDLYFESWGDERKTWRRREWVGHIADIRREFIQHCERWARFLEAESLRLQSPRGDSATSTGETEVPSKHPRKRTNGRPVEYNLNKTQLSAIEKRLKKGETVRSIWQQYKKGIPVEATFRRKIAHLVPKTPKQH